MFLIYIFTNPSARAGYDTRSIFMRSWTGLNSEFSFYKISCPTKAEESSLPCYLPIVGVRTIGFIPFPRVLCEMPSVSSRIWLVSSYPFLTTISITPRAPPKISFFYTKIQRLNLKFERSCLVSSAISIFRWRQKH